MLSSYCHTTPSPDIESITNETKRTKILPFMPVFPTRMVSLLDTVSLKMCGQPKKKCCATKALYFPPLNPVKG
jgi:hypothetical protein